MGYQESLIYIQPQEQVGQIVKEYLMARQQDPSGRFLADIPAAVRLQAPLKGCPAGSVLLWAAGERSNNIGDCPDFARCARSRWRIYSICLTMRSGTGSKMSTLHTTEALNICRWTCILVDAGAAKNEQGKRRRRAGAVMRFGLFRWNIK